MAFIDWDHSFSVGIISIDEQHLILVNMINAFYERIGKGERKENLATLISGLKDYTVKHFSYEEEMMEKFGFEGYKEHKKEHDDFLAKVMVFEEKFINGELILSYDILSFLSVWLLDHMKGSDRNYIEVFIENGVK